MVDNTPTRKWLKNIYRSFMIFLGAFLSITFSDTLDHFLGVTGALFGIPLILIAPTICHYYVVAETRCQKSIDIIILIISFAVMVLCTYNGIANWVES